jgi:hypothetical protein
VAVDWAAALAEVEGKIAKLQTVADYIRAMKASAGVSPTSPNGGVGGDKGEAPTLLLCPVCKDPVCPASSAIGHFPSVQAALIARVHRR